MSDLKGTAVNATAKKEKTVKAVVETPATPVHQIDAATGFGIPLVKDTVIIPLKSITDKMNKGDRGLDFKAPFTHALMNHEQTSAKVFGQEFGNLLLGTGLKGIGIEAIADRVLIKCEIVATIKGTNYPSSSEKGYYTAGTGANDVADGSELHRLVVVAFVIPENAKPAALAAEAADLTRKKAKRESNRGLTDDQIVAKATIEGLQGNPEAMSDFIVAQQLAAIKLKALLAKNPAAATSVSAPVAQAPIVDENEENEEELENEEL